MQKKTYIVLTALLILLASILLFVATQIQNNRAISPEPMTLTPSVPNNQAPSDIDDSVDDQP